MKLTVLPTLADLAEVAAADFVAIARAAIDARGRFTVALTGGATPKETYELLATEPYAARVDWSRVHVFWGDERCVPSDHADSNFRMARAALLDHVAIPATNIHRMRGEDDPILAAAAYERLLDEIVPDRFDLILLGMGADGHIASLFPHTPALHETVRRVYAQYVDAVGMWRLTLTPVAINRAAHITFMVAGAGKADAVARVHAGPNKPDAIPAQLTKAATGRVLWLVDAAAAR